MNNDEALKMLRDAGITYEDTSAYFEYRFGKLNNWEWKEEDMKLFIKQVNEWKKKQKTM